MSCRHTSDLTRNDIGSSSSSVLMVRTASTSTQATVAHRVLTFLRWSVLIRTTAPGRGFTSTPSLSTKVVTRRRCCSVTIVRTKVCRPECRLRTTLTSACFRASIGCRCTAQPGPDLTWPLPPFASALCLACALQGENWLLRRTNQKINVRVRLHQ